MTRVLFLGLGGVGQRHLRNLRRLRPDALVAAVRRQGRVFEIADDLRADMDVDIHAKYGVEALPDLAAGLAWKPDAAVVSTPSALHAEHVAALVEAGIHVFVEKPAVTAPGEMDRLCSLAAARAVKVAVGYQLRHHPCVADLRGWLTEERVGRVQSVEITVHSHMPSWHAYERPDQFYAGRRDLGGGVVLTEIHEIDLLCRLFGRPRRLAAFGGALSGLGLDVEDTVSAAIELDGGIPATLALSFVQAPPLRRFVVNGALGRMTINIPALSSSLTDAAGTVVEAREHAGFDRNRMFLTELDEFLAWIGGGAAPSTTLAGIRDGQDTALALLAALERRTIVDV